MAGNQKVTDFPILSAPIGSEVYVVKSSTDYRLPLGSALGVATLGVDGKLDPAQLPPAAAGVTSVSASVSAGMSVTGSPITTSGTLAFTLSANLQAWSALAPASKADTVHTHTLANLQQSGATSGQVPQWNGTAWTPATVSGGGGGTVSSVGITGSTGLSITGSPVTNTGVIDIALSANLQAWSALATSAKANTVHTHAAADITSGTFAAARLGAGTANNTTFLRGDGIWAAVSGGGTGTVTSVDISGGTGVVVGGGPVTSTGTLNVSLSTNLQSWSGINPSTKSDTSHTHSFSSLTGKPTTAAGYGITDVPTSGQAGFRLSDLYIGADSDIYLYESATNTFTIRTGSANQYFTFAANGELSAKDFVASSDARYKTAVTTLVPRGDLRPVQYTLKSDGSKSTGFIAQEVEELYPELVSTDEDGYKALNYSKLTAVLYAELLDLRARVKLLEERAV